MPKEVADAGATNWKNVNGTGPFMLTDFVAGQLQHLHARIPIYWDKEKIGGQEYKLPFVDKLIYRTIKDEATSIRRSAPPSSTSWRRSAGSNVD